MYALVPAIILEDSRLKDGAKLLYGVLHSMSNLNELVDASNSQIAKKSHIKERTVRRYLQELKLANHLVITYFSQKDEISRTIELVHFN